MHISILNSLTFQNIFLARPLSYPSHPKGPFKYNLTPEGGGGSKILEKCEDHYRVSHFYLSNFKLE